MAIDESESTSKFTCSGPKAPPKGFPKVPHSQKPSASLTTTCGLVGKKSHTPLNFHESVKNRCSTKPTMFFPNYTFDLWANFPAPCTDLYSMDMCYVSRNNSYVLCL